MFIKKKLLFISLYLIGIISIHAQETYHKVIIHNPDGIGIPQLIKYGLDADHGMEIKSKTIECIISHSSYKSLKNNGINVDIAVPDMQEYYAEKLKSAQNQAVKDQLIPKNLIKPDNFNTGSMGGYYTLEEIYNEMKKMQEFSPEYIGKPDTIGYTGENRPILSWQITSQPFKQLPKTLYTALHHAREPAGATTLIYFLWDLLEKGKKGDAQAQYLLANRLLVMIPCLNPDGYAFNQEQKPQGGGLWRKNRRIIDAEKGVDLNRNYGPESYWNANNGGSSTDPKSDVYRGEKPFSEPETQAIKKLCETYQFGFIMNYHTYSNLFIYPFAAISQETPDSMLLRGFAADITRYNKYSAGRDLETVGYTTRGNSDDWAYSTFGAMAFTPEVGNPFEGFWPGIQRIIPLAAENIHCNYQGLWSSADNICLRQAVQNISTLQDDGGIIDIDFQNIGRLSADSLTLISIRFLNDYIIKSDTSFGMKYIKSGDFIRASISYRLQKNFRNGDTVPFIVSRNQYGVIRSDTLSMRLYKPEIISVFSTIKDTSNFILNSWKPIYIKQLNSYALTDSPSKNYIPQVDSYTESSVLFDLSQYRAAEFQFIAKWSIEPRSDFAVVQLSDNEGRTWNSLQTSRMKLGSGIGGGKQDPKSYGFEGNFPDWEYQTVSLQDYIGKKIKLRFGVLSDEGAEFDGFYIRDAKILGFQDSMSDIKDTPQNSHEFVSELFPNPVSSPTIYITLAYKQAQLPAMNYRVMIHDLKGKELFRQSYSTQGSNEEIIPINVSGFSNGMYTVSIHVDDSIVYSHSLHIAY